MASTAEITIAPLPTAEEVALTLLQALFATNGTPTDYNIGSIVRTYSEAIGSVEEIEGVTNQAQALQAMVYSAYSAFGISPLGAEAAVGVVTFSTLSGSPLPAGQSVLIPINTIVQNQSGVQFNTTASVTLVSGTSNITTSVVANVAGSDGNVTPGSINQIVTGLAYPLSVTNTFQTTGGSDAETAAATLGRFLAYVYSLGLCSPIAVASAAIGVAFGQEQVEYSTCYEGWIAQVNQGNTQPNAGFQLYIDNGSGTASSGLISAVTAYLSSGVGVNANGDVIGNGVGYRPAGVPFAVVAVQPIFCSVQITATVINTSFVTALANSITTAINAYFGTLNFGDVAQLTGITAAVADVSFGQLTNLSVTLSDSTGNPQSTIPPPNIQLLGFQRVLQSAPPVVTLN